MTPAVTRVAVFTSSRADLGPLVPVLRALHDAPDLALRVLVAAGHTVESFHADLAREGIAADATDRVDVVAVGPPVHDTDRRSLALGAAALAAGTAGALDGVDVLVVLGDRWELMWVVPPAVLRQVRVVHLHGGEVTEGALDERVRHAVTKLADQHCVASADSARRVVGMGEQASRVHVTGAPGLDRLTGLDPVPADEFEAAFGLPLRRPFAVLTYHPPTAVAGLDPGAVRAWADAVLDETARVCPTVLATHPGLDPGREEVMAALSDAAARHPGLVVLEKLGPLYPRVLATADVVVGNSSSGIIEAASFRLPVVDVGDRQKGRLRGANVVSVPEGADAVREALATALAPEFRAGLADLVNPYGDGTAAARIVDVVRAAGAVPAAKPFAADAWPAPSGGPR